MRSSAFVLLALVAAACTPRAVTPSSRTLVLDSPTGPALGKADAQIDVSRIGTIWGPELGAGNARVRTTVSPGVTLEADAGLLHVTNNGDGPDRNAYTGRLGAIFSSEDGTAALTAGAGGGMSNAAGTWASFDVGFLLTGKHRYVRPLFGADLGYAAPLGTPRTFAVVEPDGTSTELRLPRNLVGKGSLGVELGRPQACLVVGVGFAQFWLRESSVVDDNAPPKNETFFAAGVGARFALD